MISKKTEVSLVLTLVLAATISMAAEPSVAPVFESRPRLSLTAKELKAWKADPARSNEWAGTIATAEAALTADLTVPEKEGEWLFYYACPKDNGYLGAETPEKHVCPVCKTVYTDERTIAAYRTIRNDAINQRIVELAMGFALTGDVKYAKPVRDVLLRLAELYPTWKRHDRWGRTGLLAVVGGLRYSQLLDEATSSMKLASAYDLTANASCFSDADRATVETKLLKFIAKDIQSHDKFIEGRNNHQTWFNAAYATVGLVTGDADLLKAAVYGPVGLLWQLDNSVTEDGIWYEGANAYHFYALSAIQQTLDVVKKAGWEFPDNARLKSLWLGPIQMTYPDGGIPVFHDSDPASINGYGQTYQWALDYFKDPVFAPYAGGSQARAAVKPLGSHVMKGIGIAALRSGTGDNSSCAMIDYGMHGGHHGHPDKLNFVLYGLGREWLLDPGRLTYSVPEYETWCRTTVAHNTLVIDGQSQKEDTGKLAFFQDANGFAAALCTSDEAYPGYQMKRFTILAEGFMVDVLAVEGKQATSMDWFIHSRGAMTNFAVDGKEAAFKPLEKPMGIANGYQHLTEVKTAGSGSTSSLMYDAGNGKNLRVILADDGASTLFAGAGIGYNLNDKVQFLARRRQASSTAFITVFDLGGAKPAVQAVELVPVMIGGKKANPWEAVGLMIVKPIDDQTPVPTLVALDLRVAPTDSPTIDGRGFERILFESAKPTR